jgi:hypothetical protein
MADVKDLREKMARIATEARSKLAEVTDKTEEARAAEIEREFDSMMAEHDRLSGVAQRMEKLTLPSALLTRLTCRSALSLSAPRLRLLTLARPWTTARRSTR